MNRLIESQAKNFDEIKREHWPDRCWLKDRLGEGLELLLAANFYGQTELCEQMAVRLSELRLAGVTTVDMRWLYLEGLAEHLVETPAASDGRRRFHQGSCNIAEQSCFLLTELGLSFAVRITQINQVSSNYNSLSPHAVPRKFQGGVSGQAIAASAFQKDVKPEWNSDRQELWFSGQLIKRYRIPSPNQNAILCAFEEDGWPDRIDDPLPPKIDQDPKRRLHDTIRNLNRAQKHPLLKFVGDGSGAGVLWERLSGVG